MARWASIKGKVIRMSGPVSVMNWHWRRTKGPRIGRIMKDLYFNLLKLNYELISMDGEMYWGMHGQTISNPLSRYEHDENAFIDIYGVRK